MWLLDGSSVPNSMTIDNFMNQKLVGTVEEIFMEISRYNSKAETHRLKCISAF